MSLSKVIRAQEEIPKSKSGSLTTKEQIIIFCTCSCPLPYGKKRFPIGETIPTCHHLTSFQQTKVGVDIEVWPSPKVGVNGRIIVILVKIEHFDFSLWIISSEAFSFWENIPPCKILNAHFLIQIQFSAFWVKRLTLFFDLRRTNHLLAPYEWPFLWRGPHFRSILGGLLG